MNIIPIDTHLLKIILKKNISYDELYYIFKNAYEKATKEFKDDFIYKLRTSIETVKSQIDELNLALKDVKFGKDSYRFIVTPNKDFVDYYNMITSPLLLNPQSGSNDFIEQYGRKFCTDGKFSLTYNPIYLMMKKR